MRLAGLVVLALRRPALLTATIKDIVLEELVCATPNTQDVIALSSSAPTVALVPVAVLTLHAFARLAGRVRTAPFVGAPTTAAPREFATMRLATASSDTPALTAHSALAPTSVQATESALIGLACAMRDTWELIAH